MAGAMDTLSRSLLIDCSAPNGGVYEMAEDAASPKLNRRWLTIPSRRPGVLYLRAAFCAQTLTRARLMVTSRKDKVFAL